MNFRNVMIGAAALILAGCEPGSDAQINGLVAHGNLSVEAGGENDPYDLKLVFPNARDFGYDLDNRVDREKFIRGAVSRSCQNPSIIDQRRVETSVSPLGRSVANYTVLVACS